MPTTPTPKDNARTTLGPISPHPVMQTRNIYTHSHIVTWQQFIIRWIFHFASLVRVLYEHFVLQEKLILKCLYSP